MAAVPAPLYAQAVPHPTPRVVWTAPGNQVRLVALDWTDAAPVTYAVQALHQRCWEAAGGEECWTCFVALARWLDALGTPPRARRPAKSTT